MRARAIGRLAASLVVIGAIPLVISEVAPADSAGGGATPTTLRVNTFSNPIGLGDATPNLSWRLSGGKQSAYEIRVASSAGEARHARTCGTRARSARATRATSPTRVLR